MSDWGGTKDPVASVNAGLDTAMPGGGKYYIREVRRAFAKGRIAGHRLTEIGERYKTLSAKADAANLGRGVKTSQEFDAAAHNRLAQMAAEQSAVLLKNEGGLLPIGKPRRVAVIGEAAGTPHYQGGGASNVPPAKLASVCDVIGEYADFVYARDGHEAVTSAANCDIAIVFAAYGYGGESEGYDRDDLSLPAEQNELIEKVGAANPNTVVVLMAGRAVEMPWIAQVRAVLFAGLTGQANGPAICRLLFGEVSPCGKLSETFPVALADVPSVNYFGSEHIAEYRESIFVGYKYYDSAGKDVLFPFGHGLSYSQFEYSGLTVNQASVTVRIKNTGKVTAAEVVQLYIRQPRGEVFMAEKQLRGFEKVLLSPNEEKEISFELTDRDFAYYNSLINDWHVPGGVYGVLVGSSSRDIRLRGELELRDSGRPLLNCQTTAPEYYTADIQRVRDASFAAVLARELPSYSKLPYHDESTLQELEGTWLGKSITGLVTKQLSGGEIAEQAGGYSQRYMLTRIAPYLPLFSLTAATDGLIGKGVITLVLFLMNIFAKRRKSDE